MTKPELLGELAKKEPKIIIQYENVLGGWCSSIASARLSSPRDYAVAVETYAVMNVPEIADKAIKKLEEMGLKRCEYSNVTPEKMRLYDDLWRFINNELSEMGWMFKKSSYQIGIEDR